MKIIEFDDKRKYDVIPVGRLAVDFNPVDYYKPLSESTTFKKYVGGSPANIAVGLSRLNKKVSFFSCVSDDQFGDFVINFFKKNKIDTSKIVRAKNGEKIGLTFTEILSESESSILMYRNNIADLQLCVDDIDEEYIKDTKFLLISGTSLCESPSREAALKAMNLAIKNNTPIIFDIDYRNYNWKNKDEIAIYYSIVASNATIILGSREEYDLTEKFCNLDGSDSNSAKFWLSKNAKIVVIKHGIKGSCAYCKDGNNYSVKPFPVKALKGFGGGDGYASAFIYGILERMEIQECLELGSASASILVASHSCSEDMPSIEKLKQFIQDEKKEYGEVVKKI